MKHGFGFYIPIGGSHPQSISTHKQKWDLVQPTYFVEEATEAKEGLIRSLCGPAGACFTGLSSSSSWAGRGVPGRSTAGRLAWAHRSTSLPIHAVIATEATSLLFSARLLPTAALLKALHGKLLMRLSVPFSDHCPLIGASRVLLLAA